MRIQTTLQVLEYEGKVLQDASQLEGYGVGKDSTIIMNMRMRGGSSTHINPNANTRNPNGSISFKDVLKGNNVTPIEQP